MLSSIRAAMQDSQTAWAQQIGADHILKLMKDLSKTPTVVSWFNELVDSASRCDLLLVPSPGRKGNVENEFPHAHTQSLPPTYPPICTCCCSIAQVPTSKALYLISASHT